MIKGRKALPKSEKRHPITVFVKAKHYAATKKAIERITTAIENNKDARKVGLAGGKNNSV